MGPNTFPVFGQVSNRDSSALKICFGSLNIFSAFTSFKYCFNSWNQILILVSVTAAHAELILSAPHSEISGSLFKKDWNHFFPGLPFLNGVVGLLSSKTISLTVSDNVQCLIGKPFFALAWIQETKSCSSASERCVRSHFPFHGYSPFNLVYYNIQVDWLHFCLKLIFFSVMVNHRTWRIH